MAERPHREHMPVNEIRRRIGEVLQGSTQANGLRSPDGVRKQISDEANKMVLKNDFHKALDQEVEIGNVERGKDRIWLRGTKDKKRWK